MVFRSFLVRIRVRVGPRIRQPIHRDRLVDRNEVGIGRVANMCQTQVKGNLFAKDQESTKLPWLYKVPNYANATR